jgi:hypothetical protein
MGKNIRIVALWLVALCVLVDTMDPPVGEKKVKRKRDDTQFRFVNPATDGGMAALIEELQKKIAEKLDNKAKPHNGAVMEYDGKEAVVNKCVVLPKEEGRKRGRPKKEITEKKIKRKYNSKIKSKEARNGFELMSFLSYFYFFLFPIKCKR